MAKDKMPMNSCRSCLKPIYHGSETHCQFCLDMRPGWFCDFQLPRFRRALSRGQCMAYHKRTGVQCHNRHGHPQNHFASVEPQQIRVLD